jgi:hypothetical protein
MRRRKFIKLIGGAAATWPMAARAQLGLLYAVSAEEWADRTAAMRQDLNESGFVEGRNVAIEYRWADGHLDRLPAMAADFVRPQPRSPMLPRNPDEALDGRFQGADTMNPVQAGAGRSQTLA